MKRSAPTAHATAHETPGGAAASNPPAAASGGSLPAAASKGPQASSEQG